ncbi:MAG TPA: RHS repeat-associated core domain-containing protein [Terriglobales bacterium]|nr:RHS repeat-associated core domain-containing protein [Terriglobales bacterium]
MRAELRHAFLLVLILLAGIQYGWSQAATGPYPFGTFDSKGIESINVGNLNVHLDIPVFHKTGRGIPFAYDLTFDNLLWQPVGVSGSQAWEPADNFGWLAQTVVMTGYLSYSTHEYLCDYPPPERKNFWIYDTWVYHDPWGRSHSFNGELEYDPSGCDSTINSFTSGALDGSGYTLTATRATRYGPLAQQQITSSYGRSLVVPTSTVSSGSSITDSNGNQVSVSSAGVYTDTLGTSALAVAGAAPGNVTLTYPNASGGTASYTIKYATYNIQTTFGCSGIGEYSASGTSLISEIDLPDGTNYLFSYEATPGGSSGSVTGRIASIMLPTGGSINYSYSGGCNGNGMNPDGTVGSLTRTTSDGTKSYGRSPVNVNATSTDVQDEVGNHTVYQFTIASNKFYETHRQVHNGNDSAPILLDKYTCYNGAAPPCDGAPITVPISETIVWSSLNGGLQSAVTNSYDSVGLLTSSSQSDYGGASLETESISYNSLGEPIEIQNMDPSSHVITDTEYGYDETAPVATSGIPQHIGGSSSGNQTTAKSWLNTDGSWFTTNTAYYDTGVPVSSTGPTGTTQFSYDSTQAFATQTTLPTPSSGVTLATSASYDQQSGVALSATGMNPGQTVQATQYDNLLRPVTITMPDGGQTTYTYNPNQTVVSSKINSSQSSDQETFYDGYGRVIRTAVFNGSVWYLTDSCYDATGRLKSQSVPYASANNTGPEVCSGNVTTYTYDALGRVTNINNADGNTQYTYNRYAVEVTDVNGVQKITQSDALGRVTKVCEISGSTLQGDAHTDCGSDIAGTGFVTTYAYDLANHKVVITQGAQTRTFQTDSLGRTIFTQEPESGQTTYSYAYNGTGLQVTRTRPRANQTNPGTTTTTTTQYDAVGRPVSISYNDGTPTKTYSYDVAANWPGFSQVNLKGQLSWGSVNTNSNWAGETFDYDTMGRVAGLAECLPSGCGNSADDKHLAYTYDLAGNLTSAGDGAGTTASYSYSNASQVTGISSSMSGPTYPSALVSNVQQSVFGPLTYSFGNGLSQYNVYDSLGRLNGGWVCIGAPSNACPNQRYGFVDVSQGSRMLWSSDDVTGGGTTYGFDEFNRLTSTAYSSGTMFSYTYDRYGNRWSQSVTGGSGPAPSYTFNKANNEITNPGFAYDAAGNMTNDGFHSYTYDADGNVTQVDGGATATYTYNAFNQRVRVDQGSTATEYVFNASGQRVSMWDGHTLAQIQGQYYWGSMPVAFYSGGSLHFQHQDWEGMERVRTSYNGGMDGDYASLPWGDGFGVNGADDDAYHYAQLDHDSESNTEHAQFRNYSSTQGRWLRPDPYMGSYDLSDPQSFNRYVYAHNDPLLLTDPSGLCDGLDSLAVHAHEEPSDSGTDICNTDIGTSGGSDGGAYNDGGDSMDPSSCVEAKGCYNVSTPLPPPPDPQPGLGVESTLTYCSIMNCGPQNNGCPPNCGFTMKVNVSITVPNSGSSNTTLLSGSTLPNCYVLAAGTVAGDLFPFAPGPFAAFDVAKGTAAAAGVMQTNRALSYWMSQGLRYPSKSSVFRGMMKTAGRFAELADVMPVIALDASLGHAIYVELTVPCKVP